MASIINTNIPSLFAQRNLSKSQQGLETSLQRLSSGLRINSAKDDAAGLSIAERMVAQVRGLDQAARNANDAISLVQTAEGGLNDITAALQRLRELSVQSANATNTDLDRAALQEEASQLVDEIDRISDQTDFNGLKLLDGSFTVQTFQVGANANQQIDVSVTSARTSELGAVQAASLNSRQSHLTSSGDANRSLHTIDQGDLVINGSIVGGALASDDTASSVLKEQSAIAKAAVINRVSDESGVKATVNTNTALGSGMVASAAGTHTVTINGVTVLEQFDGAGMSAADKRAAVVSAINDKTGQTGVIAKDTGTADGGVVLEAADGRNIHVSGATIGTISSDLGLETGVHLGSYSLSSDLAIEISDGGGRLSDAGVFRGTYETQKAYVSSEADRSTSFNAGDFVINGSVIGDSLAADDTSSNVGKLNSAISKAAAINRLSEQSGVQAVVNENIVAGVSMAATAVSGSMTINGISTGAISTTGDAGESRRITVDSINAISDQTGVQAIDTGIEADGVKLIAADGRNIQISNGAALTSAATGVLISTGSIQYGSFTLASDAEFTIEAGFNSEDGVEQLGLGVGSYGQGRSGEALDKLDISTQAGATQALISLDNAIQTVNSQRSSLGAVQNRFSSTISNLSTQSENITAAKSRILDADFAKETAELTRNQILQQAGVAMLSQANQVPQQVLQLLQG